MFNETPLHNDETFHDDTNITHTPGGDYNSDSDTSSTSTVPYEEDDSDTDDTETLYQPTTRAGRILRSRIPTDYSNL